MTWLRLVQSMLQLTVIVVRWIDEKQQQQIGRDLEVKRALAELSMRSAIAQQMAEDLSRAGDDDVIDQLRDDFRD